MAWLLLGIRWDSGEGDQSASQRGDMATCVRWQCQAMMKHRAEGVAGAELFRDRGQGQAGVKCTAQCFSRPWAPPSPQGLGTAKMPEWSFRPLRKLQSDWR